MRTEAGEDNNKLCEFFFTKIMIYTGEQLQCKNVLSVAKWNPISVSTEFLLVCSLDSQIRFRIKKKKKGFQLSVLVPGMGRFSVA